MKRIYLLSAFLMILGTSLIAQQFSLKDLAGFEIGDTKAQVEKSLAKVGCELYDGGRTEANTMSYKVFGAYRFLGIPTYDIRIAFKKNKCVVFWIEYFDSDFAKLRGIIDSLKKQYKDYVEEREDKSLAMIKFRSFILLINSSEYTLTFCIDFTKKKKKK